MIKIKKIEEIEISIPIWFWLLLIAAIIYLISNDATYILELFRKFI